MFLPEQVMPKCLDLRLAPLSPTSNALPITNYSYLASNSASPDTITHHILAKSTFLFILLLCHALMWLISNSPLVTRKVCLHRNVFFALLCVILQHCSPCKHGEWRVICFFYSSFWKPTATINQNFHLQLSAQEGDLTSLLFNPFLRLLQIVYLLSARCKTQLWSRPYIITHFARRLLLHDWWMTTLSRAIKTHDANELLAL